MFAHAVKTACCFTRPVVISRRYFDRSTDCGTGTFVVINEEGWILTAAHLLSSLDRVRRDADEILGYYAAIDRIGKEAGLSPEQKAERIRGVRENPKWITDVSYWWGMDGARLVDVRTLPEGDLVAGRLAPFDRWAVRAYPVIKSPGELDKGIALCKLGFPFQRVEAMFREACNSFDLGPSVRSLSCFPMDGIYTRTLDAGKSGDGKYDIKFLETSSPGLKGQSGGPILDDRGTVWGILSRTDSHVYGSIARQGKDGVEVEENQLINFAVGVHPEVIVRFLSENGIRFSLSDY